ncbi:uncharacterized protein LOC135958516 [Calliphora vicina]|uniref:uncharacterized protein LOC135958516 n=1 Tax=Calliphora vicina TaxID=7373 RepID=UPI00325BC073
MDMSALIRNADRLAEFEAHISIIPVGEHRIGSLSSHEKELNRLWEAVRSAYDTLLIEAEQLKTPQIVEVKARYMASYSTYTRGISMITTYLDNLKTSAQAEKSIDQGINSMPFVHLPPCDTPIFYGDYKNWPSFRDMFSALYGNNPRLTPVQKLYYLLQKTAKDAHDVIQTVPLTNDGYAVAWKKLVDTYENKDALINEQLRTLLSIKPITQETGPNIKNLQRTLNDCITNLSLLEVTPEIFYHVMLVYICATKLPENTLSLWEQSKKLCPKSPKWEDMDAFLTAHFKTLESISDIRQSNPVQNMNKTPNTLPRKNSIVNAPKKSFNDSRKVQSFATKTNPSSTVCRCFLCQGSHPLRLCPNFLSQTVDDRMSTVKRLRCCSNCLATSHDFKNCRSTHVCSLCRQKHHSLLHRDQRPQGQNSQLATQFPIASGTNVPLQPPYNVNPIPASTQNQPPLNFTPSTSAAAQNVHTYAAHLSPNPHSTVLLGSAICIVHVNDLRCAARALVDPGSQGTFISRRLQRKLSIPTFSVPSTNVTGMMDCLAGNSSTMCVLSVGSPIDPSFKLKICAYVVEKITGRLPSCTLSDIVNSRFPDITMPDVMCTRMDILFGGNVYPKILTSDVRKHPNGNLIAQRTVFGWIVTGEVFQSEPMYTLATFCNQVELNAQLARFWELEEVPQATRWSEREEICEELYRTTTYRNPDGRYVVSLPFRREFYNEVTLGDSRHSALSQFMRNETRLLKNPQLKSQYDTVISEYFEMGHIKAVNPSDSKATSYYLPHHAVFKPDSLTTKLRVVFNASNPSSNGVSLNNILYPGPVLQADLTVLILQWRLFRYVFNADIEKMYRQILIHPEQTQFQRIFYRNNPEADIKDYELNTVTFGVNCAPYLAIRTLLQLANDCEPQSPLASQILKTQMYVDDVLAGSHELEDAFERRIELTHVLESAGFVLRKWTANHIRLLEDLPRENLLDADFLKFADASTTKTLSLRWNADTDSFYFRLISQPRRDIVTKRAVLSEIAKLFDPAGWLSPKIIVARIIMQQIWKDKTDWDESLKTLTLAQWRSFLNDYPNIEKINIPRWVNFHPSHEIELHAFSDASEKAYGCALYVRSISANEITSHLLSAKTKVAPVKSETLPRLELCGAALMANMVESLCSQLNLDKRKIYMWTDSTIVLSWLKKPPCHWPTFVKNRVALIVKKVGNENWFHVDSKDNPADLASRGTLARDLVDNPLWWHGPSWLRQPREYWPQNIVTEHLHLEVQTFSVQTELKFDILERFSDLPRAMRIISYWFRCLQYLKTRKCLYNTLDLTQSEMRFTRDRLVLVCQKNYIPEYSLLSKGKPISSKSNLLTLNPFIDSNGFVRINGRLVRSPGLTYDERYPKILPYAARFTRLFVEHVHKCSAHGGHSLMLRLVRNEFWVPKLKNLIRTVIFNCKECTIYRKKTGQQIMAALPPERASLSRPFTHTGLDFAGPFDIKSYIGRGCRITKGYVLVFVCFATKAIHLEATGDMSTETFLAAFARFFSRRGCPAHVYSDNGTAFVGAANLLEVDRKQFLLQLRQKVFVRNSSQPVEWHFIPPGAPHMGGLWEAGVKSVKTHFRKIAGMQKFTFEEFSTMLSRIEACLNSRPLTAMSDDPLDLVPLTPGHFLIGAPLLAPPEPNHSDLSLSIANRWQKLKVLHHQFALRWKEEYLKELHRRTKWKYPQRDLKVGDLVVIRQDNLPPNEWRLGRIEKTHVGQDSKVRSADVRTASGIFTRPIVKLVLLPKSEAD